MEFTNQSLMCATCGQTFSFTTQEQAFYREKGFQHTPKRCRECRRAKRAMQSGNGTGAPGRSGPRRSGNHRPDGQSECFEAVCNTCGASVKLPFQPDGVRPVFCRPCFEERRGNLRT